MMNLNDSFPLLKKLSGFASTPTGISMKSKNKKMEQIRQKLTVDTSIKNATNESDPTTPATYTLSPGLPKSPRPNLTPETASIVRRPVLMGGRGRSDHIDTDVTSRQRSLTPTTRRRQNNCPPSPIMNMIADSRDDSQYGGSIGHGDDMDDVLIHRYLSEKSKVRASEAKNVILHSHIDELNRHIDDQGSQAEKDRAVAETKIYEQGKMANSLENAIKDLRDQISKQSLDHEKQTKAVGTDVEHRFKSIRKEGANAIEALQNEFTGVQMKYSASQKMLEEEKNNLSQMTVQFNEMQNRSERGTKVLDEQVRETNALKLKIVQMEEENAAIKTSSDGEVEMLRNALDNINEMLDFQNSKGNELSAELKIMSYHYVQSMEKLAEESAKTENLLRELDTIEGKLKDQMKQNTVVASQLEKMARGYIDTDGMLEKERSDVEDLTSKLNIIRVELAEERSKSEELATDLEATTMSLRKGTDDNLKLTGVASSSSSELASVKKTLAKSLTKVKSLSKKLKESQALCTKTEDELKKEQEQRSVLETELGEAKEKNISNLADLTAVKTKLNEDAKAYSVISTQLKEKTTAHDAIDAALRKERADYEKAVEGGNEENVSLSTQLKSLQEDYSNQKDLAAALKTDLNATREQCDHLNATVRKKTEESTSLQKILATEKEEFAEKRTEQDETIFALTNELESLETKHTALFDNLVETESKLQTTKESLENTKILLERKEAEFEPIEKMLKEEISLKDEALKRGQEKSHELSTQLVEMNKKNNVLHSTLAGTEQRVIKTEEQSQSLQNELMEYQRKCKKLSLTLDRERNGPAQRKLKVAKRMIRAEKDRYLAVLNEIEAKNLIIGRIENQSETYKSGLMATKNELKIEKEKKATHSGRALQDLHKQLEDERKNVKKEKEQLRTTLKAEKSKVKSLTMRLSAAEGSSEGATEVSRALKTQYDTSEQVRMLTEKNEELLATVKEQNKVESVLKKQLVSMESKLREIVHSMDTMAQYCSGLEEERRVLKRSLENTHSPNKAFCGIDNAEDSDGGDEDTLDGRSLSDFSVAQIPAPRQTHREFLKKRTAVSNVDTDGEKIELTVDTRHLYD
jgi:chromosome segregation ATPase